MSDRRASQAPAALPSHGAQLLPSVSVDSYNLELRDDDGAFLGDRVNKGAFRKMIDGLRKTLRKTGDDPLGKKASDQLEKSEMDDLLYEGDAESAGIIHGAIEDFANELAFVIRRFLKVKAWRDTERISVGGGLRASRVGELAIGRAAVILRSDEIPIEMAPCQHDPDGAGLIGALHLVPAWMLEGYDAILAVDIGGTNIRTGVIEHRLKQASDLSKAAVSMFDTWRHADDKPSRAEAIERLIKMLKKLIPRAEKAKIRVAPLIGVGCPGRIEPDGSVDRGGAESAGRLGKRELQPAGVPPESYSEDRQARDHRPDA
jgi:predicted NBD/HSP70 family sugar kinase